MPEIKKYLNRDGLDEYNSLLPHSSAEMQEYVNDWLDEHPEATTTVQDGAITEPKLADKSVSLRTLADDTVHMLKGMILTKEISGEVLTADDTYSAPPVALTVDGKSTQDGTPTPESPVEIVSLEQVGLTFAGKNLFDPSDAVGGTYINSAGQRANGSSNTSTGFIPIVGGDTYTVSYSANNSAGNYLAWYTDADQLTVTGSRADLRSATSKTVMAPNDANYVRFSFNSSLLAKTQFEAGSTATEYQPYDSTSVLLNLTQALRSLPDGTKDTLALSYLRPSTREGCAWYSPTLTQNVGYGRLTNFSQFTTLSNGHHRVRHGTIAIIAGATHSLSNRFVYNSSTYNYGNPGDYYISSGYMYCIVPDELTTLEAVNAWASDNITILQFVLSPRITTLDPIELPILPAPDVTVWSDPSTGLQMEYVRDSNIVIQRIEQAIADM